MFKKPFFNQQQEAQWHKLIETITRMKWGMYV